MKVKIFIIIICIQIVAISILLLQIQYKKKNILGVSINSFDLKTIQQVPSGELAHFFEPIANRVNEDMADWLPYVSRQTINSDSLNERFDYEIRKKEGTFRIIALGDSYTYGSFVNTEENWTELLEDYLNEYNKCADINKYEVINLGMWGYDWAYEEKRYEKRGQKYSPDLIIQLTVDFGRVTEHRLQNQNRATLTATQKYLYRKQGNFYPELSMFDKELSDNFRINYQQKYISKLFSLYKGPFLWVDFEKNQIYQSLIQKIKNNHKEITYEETKLSWNEKKYFLPDMHPNKEGHKKLMKEIVGFLKKNKLLPCN